ncbi:hypothetical protein QYF36_011110 [Acer negundo]|nr:hypothetical protein QYF36_011110 [Acer negundo]
MWGINLIGSMPVAAGGAKHSIVAVDYFTKWVEAEPLVHITQLNIGMLNYDLDELEERREYTKIRNATYQQRAARYYNSHVRLRRFAFGDLVLRRVSPRTKDKIAGSLVDK